MTRNQLTKFALEFFKAGMDVSEVGMPNFDQLIKTSYYKNKIDAILAHIEGNIFNLQKFQQEQKEWSERNFPTQNTSYRPLLGVMEEVGELSHAHLKAEQGIRVNEDHQAAKFDAIGDIVIYLSDYCNKNGFDLQDCISKTWDQVKQRDWNKNKINGKE